MKTSQVQNNRGNSGKEEALSHTTSPRPGDRIRIEEHRFGADNFLAAAYLPEKEAARIILTSLVAVDVVTNYIVGFKLSLKPTISDAIDLLANIMRDKTRKSRYLGTIPWTGWCRPIVLEVGVESVFLNSKLRKRLEGLHIAVETVAAHQGLGRTTRLLAHKACVSPEVVQRIRDREWYSANARNKRQPGLAEDRRQYLLAVVERDFLMAITRNERTEAGKRKLNKFMEGREADIALTDHELRMMLCEEIEGQAIEEVGLTLWGHIYFQDAMDDLGYELNGAPSTIKVGNWKLDSISVRNLNGEWFDAETYDEDMPLGTTRTDQIFADIMVRRAEPETTREADEVYYQALHWLRHKRVPVFDFFKEMRANPDDRFGGLQSPLHRASLPGMKVKIEEHEIYLMGMQRVTVYLAIDVATSYVMGVKVSSRPRSEAILDTISLVMRDRDSWAAICGASKPWPGTLIPHALILEGRDMLDDDRFMEGVRRLKMDVIDGLVPVTVDLDTLMESGLEYRRYDGLLQAETLERNIVRWICDDYNHAPQVMLGGQSPAQEFLRRFDLDKVRKTPHEHDIRKAVGHEFVHVIGPEGVQIGGRWYNSEWLQELRLSSSAAAKFRLDPANPSVIAAWIENSSDAPEWHEWEDIPEVASTSLEENLGALRDLGQELASPGMVADRRWSA